MRRPTPAVQIRAARPEAEPRRSIAWLIPVACILSVLVATVVLIGWATADLDLIRVIPTRHVGIMVPLTAIGLICCAVSLWLLRPGSPASPARRWAARLLAAAAMTIGLLSLLQYVLGVDFGVDLLFFGETVTSTTRIFPGRPSGISGIWFLCGGLSLLLLDARSPALRRLYEILAYTAAFAVLESTIAYAYGEAGLYAPRRDGELLVKPVALHAAIAFLVLSLGILHARPNRGLAALTLGRDTGSLLARRLLPVAVLVPIALGWLSLIAHRIGVYGTSVGLSLMVMATIVLLVILIGLNVRTIRRIDQERNRALESVTQNELLFRAIYDNAISGIAMVDAEGRLISTNPSFQRMLGYTDAELAGKSLADITYPDDMGEDWALFYQMIGGRRASYRMEKRYISKTGGIIWVQLNASMARDRTGAPLFAIGMVDDITERRESDEERRRLTAILEATPDFVGIADADGRALFVNQAGRILTGIGKSDVSGLTIPDFHPIWAAEHVMKEGVPGALRDGLWTGESALLDANGREIPVSQVILAHRNPDGRVSYLSTLMRDISERKQQEESQRFLLEASRAFSGTRDRNALLQAITQLMVPQHADFCIVYLIADDGSIERVALVPADPHLQSLLDQLRSQSLIDLQRGVPEVLRTGESLLMAEVTDGWIRSIAGSEQHLEVLRKLAPRSCIIVPLSASSRVIGAITLGRTQAIRYDTADLTLAESFAIRASLALDNARHFSESREATRLRDQVLRVVAHDLRNPLNTIGLSAGLLEEELTPAHAKQREMLSVINRSVDRADRLIKDLLDVARIESGKLPLEKEWVETRDLVCDAVELHRAQAQERSIDLEAEIPGRLNRINLDRHRIQQVFSNLIGNALKFTPEGGRITVRAEPRDHEIRFAVTDTGPGMTAEDQSHLFHPFWQASKSEEGVGLGLVIVRGIVEAHGGRVRVETAPGKGTTFFFTLPVKAEEKRELAAD